MGRQFVVRDSAGIMKSKLSDSIMSEIVMESNGRWDLKRYPSGINTSGCV